MTAGQVERKEGEAEEEAVRLHGDARTRLARCHAAKRGLRFSGANRTRSILTQRRWRGSRQVQPAELDDRRRRSESGDPVIHDPHQVACSTIISAASSAAIVTRR